MAEEQDEVKVEDKRKFDSDGNLKKDDKAKTKSSPKEESKKTIKKTASTEETEKQKDERNKVKEVYERGKDSEIDFISFLFSLYSSAILTMGEIPDPSTGEKIENLEQSREIIDIIAMLKEKTEGNLNQEESQAMEDILFQARMLYLKKTGGIKI